MRILLVSEVFPPRHGGSGRWFWEIYRRLDAKQTVILAGTYPGDVEFDTSHMLQVHRTPMSFPTWGVASRQGFGCYRELVGMIRERVNRDRPDQIHCGKILPEGLAAWWIHHRFGIPYLCYVHGEELSIAGASRELRWLTRRVFASAARVIANSHNTASLLRHDWQVSEDQLRVLHPGVDIDHFRPAERDLAVRSELGWDDRPVILTVGRLQKRKGHDQLIRCLPALIKCHPELLYSVIGDGPERTALRSLVKQLNLGQHVDFRGEADDVEILSCYQQCDLFALPNRTVDGDFEGFGMVLLEAQACGKSVIAGTSGGTGEAMVDGETGYRVDCESEFALTKCLTSLTLDREAIETMGNRAREWTTEHFAWDSLVSTLTREFPDNS